MTRILFPGRTDLAPKIFAIEGNLTPLINIFYCIFRSLWSQNLEKYVKFCENSQSTNILPQILLKVQILLPPSPIPHPPPPHPGIVEEYIPLPLYMFLIDHPFKRKFSLVIFKLKNFWHLFNRKINPILCNNLWWLRFVIRPDCNVPLTRW